MEAAMVFSVPKDALHRRVKGKLKSILEDQLHRKFLPAARNVLSEKQQKELAHYIKQTDSSFYGLSINEIRRLVFEFAEQNKLDHPFNKEKKMAGKDFIDGFLKRQKTLSLRKPEAIALNRVLGLNKTSVQNNFKNLQELLDTHNFEPHQIFNCDETEITCVNKPVKVIKLKGNRVVASVTSGERGQITTIICAISATDTFAPPLMVFKRTRVHPEMIERAPTGTIGSVSDSGWVDTDLFFKFLKHFVKHTKCSKDSKVPLILDGHKAHTKNTQLIDYAKENGLFCCHCRDIPHTSFSLWTQAFLKDPREAGSTEDRVATMEPNSGPSNQRIEATQNQHQATTMEPTPGPSNESLDLFVITSTASTSDPEPLLSFDKILSVPKIVAK
eukprot:gene6443-7173_t